MDHKEIRELYDEVDAYEWDRREQAYEDLRFCNGDQWDEDARAQRAEDGRPIPTINRMPAIVRQVTGRVREFKPSIKVRPVEGGDSNLADTMSGIVRNIEQESDAQAAYMTGLVNACVCSFGHWRVVTERPAYDTVNQDIRIRRIQDPFSVYWDPSAQELTREDAEYCFVVEDMPRRVFKKRFPNATEADWSQARYTTEHVDSPTQLDTIRVAEFWHRKEIKRTLAQLADGRVIDVTELDDIEVFSRPDVQQLGIVNLVQVPSWKITQRLMSGSDFLTEEKDWAGRYIPIVSVYGEEINIGDEVYYRSVIRDAKDPQRLLNYHTASALEHLALAPKAKWVLTEAMIEGNEAQWNTAHRKMEPVLLFHADPDNPQLTPRFQPGPDIPAATIQMGAIAEDQMKAVTGIYDAALGAQSNETSGRAINARTQQTATGTFVFEDNHARAIRHTGRILVDLIPKIYDAERVVRVLGEDGSEDFETINQTVMDAMGNPVVLNDLTAGKYDATVTVGPSYATQRAEGSERMLELARVMPQIAQVAGDMIAEGLDFPKSAEIAERLKKTLPPEFRDEDEEKSPEEAQAEQQQQAMQQEAAALEKAKVQAEVTKAQAEAEEAQADALKARLEAEKLQIELAALTAPPDIPIEPDPTPEDPAIAPGFLMPEGELVE